MAFLGSADRIDYSLKKVSLAGGSPITLIDRFTSGPWGSGVWLDDGTIVVSRVDSGLWRIRQDGGAPEPLTILRDDDWSHRPAAVLPDWRVLFTVVSNARLEFRIEAVSLDSGERRLVLDNAAYPWYLSSGHLLFARDDQILLAPFDAGAARDRTGGFDH